MAIHWLGSRVIRLCRWSPHIKPEWSMDTKKSHIIWSEFFEAIVGSKIFSIQHIFQKILWIGKRCTVLVNPWLFANQGVKGIVQLNNLNQVFLEACPILIVHWVYILDVWQLAFCRFFSDRAESTETLNFQGTTGATSLSTGCAPSLSFGPLAVNSLQGLQTLEYKFNLWGPER